MIKIGEFAKLFGVSIKTIRFYEEKGILFPTYVDLYSGYRYYDEENIIQMSRILFLKDLGFSIKEIMNIDENSYNEKISEYENKIMTLYKNIDTLKSLSNMKERRIDIMKTFINDENVIGKWELVGSCKTKEDFYNSIFLEDDSIINELYLMENGTEYWVISWTKGTIFICDVPCPYEVKDNLMFVKIASPIDENDYKYSVYKKIDSKRYVPEDFMIIDDTNIDFISDDNAIGIWKSIDLVHNKNAFNLNKKITRDPLFVDKLIVSPDFDVIVCLNSGKSKSVKYTKDYIINLCMPNTLSKYDIVHINSKTFMIVEWKSGDYVYGGQINCYYVFEKIN